MNVIDKLVFLFETNGAEKVADSVKKTKTKMTEAEKAAKDLDAQNKKLAGSFGELAGMIAKIAAPLYVMGKAFNAAIDFNKTGQDLNLLAQQAGMAVEKIQELGNALSSYGGSAASASAVMGGLNSNLQKMRMGQGGQLQEAALTYGLDMSGSGEQGLATADEMLVKIAKRMEGMNEQQQLDFGKMLGLDAPTIMMLQGGVKGLEEAKARAAKRNVYTKEDLERARKFNETMLDFKASMAKVGAVISRVLTPVASVFMTVLTFLGNLLSTLWPILIVVAAAIGVALVAAAVSAATALWAMILPLLIMAAPFLAIGAAIGAIGVALYLLVDDFVTFFQGGESSIGVVVDAFKNLWGHIKQFGSWLADFWKGVWDGIVDYFFSKFKTVTDAFKSIKKFLGFGGETNEAGGKSVSDSIRSGGETIEAGGKAIESTKTPLASQTSNSISNASNNSNQNSVSVQGITINTQASDAEGISKDIGQSLHKQMQSVLFSNYSGAVA